VYRGDYQDDSDLLLYLTGAYYCMSVLTTVGYGDVHAFTDYELLFSICWMLFGVAFYSFMIGIISSFFQIRETKASLVTKRVKKLGRIAMTMKISPDLEEKMAKALSYAGDKISYQWLRHSLDIFSDLSMDVKYGFLTKLHGDLIQQCPFFNNYYDPNFTVRIVPLLKPVKFDASEVIWKKNDFSDSIIFIVDGTVNFYIQVYDINRESNKYSSEEQLENQDSIINPSRSRHKLLEDKYARDSPIAQSSQEPGSTNSKAPRPSSTPGPKSSNISDTSQQIKSHKINSSPRKKSIPMVGKTETRSNNDTTQKEHRSGEKSNKKIVEVIYKIMGNGSFFGDVDMIFRRRRNCICKARTPVHAFLLSKTDFENVLRLEYPHIFKDLRYQAKVKDEADIAYRNKCKKIFKNERKQGEDKSSSDEEFQDDMAEYYENLEIDN
jgi:CRP-like cAMP-binding protein